MAARRGRTEQESSCRPYPNLLLALDSDYEAVSRTATRAMFLGETDASKRGTSPARKDTRPPGADASFPRNRWPEVPSSSTKSRRSRWIKACEARQE